MGRELMGEADRKPERRPGLLPRLALAATCLAASGCLGPTAIRTTRMRYNEAVRSTNDEQLLINLVRLRYADSAIFLDLRNITSQFELSGRGSYTGGYGNAVAGPASLGVGEVTLRDTPTLSYHPRQGREIAQAFLNPLSADLFTVVTAGARLEQLFWLTMNDVNDVPNATRATVLVPRAPDDNARFLRGVQLLGEIDDRGGAELGFTMSEEPEDASDPIATDQVSGGDLVGAAKDGYVFRAKGEGRMTLVKREKELTLRIRDPFRHSPEMEEMADIFHLTPGLPSYKIKSELQPDPGGTAAEALPIGDTIYLNLRSTLQIMTFLSKGVCVPEEHAREGIAPMTPGPDGRPFDWTRVTAGNFFIASQKHRPRDAEVAIQYRGHWFFIPRHDVNSRSVLAVLEILFALQESDDKAGGPLLTLPVGE